MAFGIGGTIGDVLDTATGSVSGAISGTLGIGALGGFGGPSDVAGAIASSLSGRRGIAPLLKPIKPPRGAALRSRNPFDFFGTLFTTPATRDLNPMMLLNQTV
jgi:hypothetical protein